MSKRQKDRPVSSPSYVAEIYPLRNLMAAAAHMSESTLRVAQYISENPERVASMSIGELAKTTGSSKAVIVRVGKLSGYKGYRGLRAALIENKGLMRGVDLIGIDLPPDAVGSDKTINLAREVVKINIEVLQDTLTLLDERTLLRTVETILGAKHVLCVGFGTSAPVVQDAYQRLLRLQIPSSTCSDSHIVASIVANMGPEDALFCISYSGTTRDIIEALETAKHRKASTITLTSVPRSAASELSDIVLVSAVRRAPQASESVAARVAQFVVIDIICAIIALRKECELEKPNERIASELSKKRVWSP
jgi:DNA-binding MurR/RpiR family transcriptional regulator